MSGSGAGAKPMQHLLRDKYNLVVSWELPVVSGIVLAAINFTFVAFKITNFSLITTLLYTAGIGLIIGCVYSNTMLSAAAAKEMSENPLELVSQETAERIAIQFRTYTNSLASASRKLLYWTSPKHSITTLAIIIITAWLLTRVSLPFLLLTVCNSVILRQPALKMYRKHAEPILLPYTQCGAEKLRALLKNIPALDSMTTRRKRL